jgi:hypothetical protein
MLTSLDGANIVFDHNTVFTDGTSVVSPTPCRPSVSCHEQHHPRQRVGREGAHEPWQRHAGDVFSGATFAGNVLIGSSAGLYPPGNYFPATVNAVGFANPAGGDCRLLPTSPYVNAALGGGAIGCSALDLPDK